MKRLGKLWAGIAQALRPAQSLDELGIKHNTDKASLDRVRKGQVSPGPRPPGHNYLVKYEHFLRHLKTKPDLAILELGAGPDWNLGASARMWAEYFPRCDEIHIAEMRPSAMSMHSDRILPRIGDLGDPRFLAELKLKSWDFILDDASHLWSHQLQALDALLPSVKPGGVYIVEDIHTSFGGLRQRFRGGNDCDALGYAGEKRPDTMTVLGEIAHYVAGRGSRHPTLKASRNTHLVNRIGARLQSICFIEHSAILVTRSRDNSYLS